MGIADNDTSKLDNMETKTNQDESGTNGAVGFSYSDGYQPIPNPKSADREQLNVITITDDDDQFSQKPNNHIIGAICVTLCCFWPTGIAAILYSLKVNKLNEENKIRQARVMAEKSKNWIIYTVCAFALLLCLATVSRIFTVVLSPDQYKQNH